MDSQIKCPGCGADNEIYRSNCKNCSYLIRERIPNIDLWSTFWNIFISPAETIKKIIQAEHKNFLIFLFILLSIKTYIDSILYKSAFNIQSPTFSFSGLLLNLGLIVSGVIAASFLLVFITNKLRIKSRWKDNMAVLVYSQIPMIVSLLIILPSAYAIFGIYLLTFVPPIHEINSVAANFLYLLESLCIIWSLWLLIKGLFIQTGRKTISVILAVFFLISYKLISFLIY